MSAPASGLYLDPGGPIAACLDLPPAAPHGTSVLIVPPFGWEENCSYRARRNWARALAEVGHPVLRIDLPSTGDSAGSPRDAELVPAWIAAVSTAARWLRARPGCQRVAAIGIALGGALACAALAEGAPIDELILWAVPSRGRHLVREARAHAGIVASRYPDDGAVAAEQADGTLELTGYAMTPETAAALEALRLDELEFSRPPLRALLLGRDGLDPDQRLRERLTETGCAVDVLGAEDYNELMTHPEEARTPHDTIAHSRSWLATPSAPREWLGPAVQETAAATLEHEGVQIRESPITLQLAGGAAFGIRTEPVGVPRAELGAVLLNPGALRHIGPSRTWVEIARRWAARGIPSVRLDFAGIGESDGDERTRAQIPPMYNEDALGQVRATIEQVVAAGLPDRLLVSGLCAGAYWSLHGALADRRVVSACALNLDSFQWSQSLKDERDAGKALQNLKGRGFRRILRRDVTMTEVLQRVRSLANVRAASGSPMEHEQAKIVADGLDQLREHEQELLLLLGRNEHLRRMLDGYGLSERAAEWPNLIVEEIPSRDHMFRALWLQRHVHERVDAALDRALARLSSVGPAPVA